MQVGVQQQSPRVMAEIRFDALGENVERSLVPASEQAPLNSLALAVRDVVTNAAYWELVSTDNAGRIQTEKLGVGATAATTTRTYFEAKDRVKSILTTTGATTIQSLSYGYDDRLNLTHRTDARQSKTEYFGYDRLDRLTSSAFSLAVRPDKYTYSQNGNLVSKPGVGSYVYDPAHPHAVWIAGGELYANDAVGNQRVRPGATIEYTAFDLPKTFALDGGAGTIELEYDGNQERVRKSTPKAETIYFGTLYERVTDKNSEEVEHRYYVHDSERLVATVTRESGEAEKTEYVHVDNLGSVDAVTNSVGTVVERRSYDAFGAPRNPQWGAGSLLVAPKLTRGFTGHESDDELGLVNMKGRLFDPKLGRFLTADPIISNPLFSQSWNAFSYVNNNPLAYVDPSGFTGVEVGGSEGNPKPRDEHVEVGIDGSADIAVTLHKAARGNPREAKEAGAAAAPVDVGVAGNVASEASESAADGPERAAGSYTTGDILIGAGTGLAKEILGGLVHTTLYLVYGMKVDAYLIAARIGHGAWENGWEGAASAANPFGSLIGAVTSTYQSVVDGDYPKAAENAVPLAIATGIGIFAGAKAGRGTGAADISATEGQSALARRPVSYVKASS